ncbi:polysaccharide pyruvyl transferase family protein [Paraglaciecola sp. 2405UD69-4]|uniref:polysaccharide pyruvyl transferase family protein n=1 Tax=Paraglaciecola sp. 2405UD69-4 TaxID=3391836 RepID=UPI0039C8EC48
MKIRAAVITYHDINNYGAQLQAASLQRFIEAQGINVHLLDYRPLRSRIRIAMVYIRLLARLDFKSFKRELTKRQMFTSSISRLANVDNFKVYTQQAVSKICASKYDYLVCGSDELWNFDNYLGYQTPYILDFPVTESTKKISYAASMGYCKPDGLLKKSMVDAISKFSTVMVRDPYTKQFVDSQSNKTAERVVDPTFLWDFKDIKPQISKKYILLTGGAALQANVISHAKKLAELENLDIVTIGATPQGLEHTVVVPTPEEWIGYIKYANYHITSLFHGSIFSMKHRTQFAVVVPSDKTQKITSLLSLFKQTNRALDVEFSEDELIRALNVSFDEDFEKAAVDAITKSKTALKMALGK